MDSKRRVRTRDEEASEVSIEAMVTALECAQKSKKEIGARVMGLFEQVQVLAERIESLPKEVEALKARIGSLMYERDFKPLGECYAELYRKTGDASYVTLALTYLFQPLQDDDGEARRVLEGLGFCDAAIAAMKDGEVGFCTGKTSYQVKKGPFKINVIAADKSAAAPDAPNIPSVAVIKAVESYHADRGILETSRRELAVLEEQLMLVTQQANRLREQLQEIRPLAMPRIKTCASFAPDSVKLFSSSAPETEGVEDCALGLDCD